MTTKHSPEYIKLSNRILRLHTELKELAYEMAYIEEETNKPKYDEEACRSGLEFHKLADSIYLAFYRMQLE
jgi:hypothetical protein